LPPILEHPALQVKLGAYAVLESTKLVAATMGEQKTSTSVAQFAQKVAAAANSSQGVEDIFDLFSAFAKERLDVSGISFWRFNLADNTAECTYLAGKTLPSEGFTSAVELENPITKSILSELTQRIAVVPAEKLRKANPELPLVREETKNFRAQLLGVFALESPSEPAPKKVVAEVEAALPSVALAFVAKHRSLGENKRLLQMRLLHQITEKALMSLNLDDLLTSTARLLKDYFLYYNVYVFIYDDQREELELKAIAGRYEAHVSLPLHLRPSQGCVGYAFSSKKAYYAPDTRDDPYYLPEVEGKSQALSELAVPIMQGEYILGVLDVQADEPESFDEFDIESMNTLANELASAITRARDYDILKSYSQQLESYQQQMEHDLHITEQILNINLPVKFISPNVDSTLHFHAHHSIGGDIVMMKLVGGYSYMVVGDVSGHGISSAMISISTISYLDNLLANAPTVEALVQSLNHFWCINFSSLNYYSTFFVCRLHNSSGSLEYVNCGHPRPILYQQSSGTYSVIQHSIPPIGLFDLEEEGHFSRQWVKLSPGDKLTLYTDGFLSEFPPPPRFTEQDLTMLINRYGHLPQPIFHQFVLWNARKLRRGVASEDDEVFLTVSYAAHPTVSYYVENMDQVLRLIRKIDELGIVLEMRTQVVDRLTAILEETAIALLARKRQAPLTPRIFVSIDFQPKRFNLALMDANVFLVEENFLEAEGPIPPLEEQLPAGSLQMVKSKVPSVEIKKIEKGLLFLGPID
jgi:serine phosphatase RsbU (regulator of sigma subunit)